MATRTAKPADDQPTAGKRKNSDTTRVFIVDDHPVVRQGVGMLVDQQNDMEVCGDAESGPEALKKIGEIEPDLAVVDLSLKDSSGMELIKDLQVQHPEIRILVLSMHDETFFAERVLRAGARGYITKAESTLKVVDGIRAVMKGEVYLSDGMSSKMISKLVSGYGQPDKPSVDALTDRELEVFELLGNGYGTREIAEKLHRSVKTIETHRERIKEKLQIDSATDLIKHAVQWVQCERTT